jgi:hypothetical protein
VTKAASDLVADFRALGTMLRGASELVTAVLGDALFKRLLDVFTAMPAEDRETMVRVLEREVDMRGISRDTQAYIGLETHLNPNARLYVRAFAPVAQASQMDEDDMMLATVRFGHVARLLLAPEHYGQWRTASREAFLHMEPEERAAVARIVDEFLGMLAEHERTEAEGGRKESE